MPRSQPLPKSLIEQFRSAANGFSGEAALERIALAVLRHFHHKEITVWDVTDTQVYFRLGDARGFRNPNPGSRPPLHQIPGVHIHPPYPRSCHPSDKKLGPWLTRADDRKHKIIPLVGRSNRPGSANDYVGELLKALEQGRYQASFVAD